ncbi:hypothetical protein [Mycobacterium sp. NPDC050441]|uniref:hypothetical protein n=1 Tax=Mycobacterium sp. NPDC050441 TaxID=3155403 RepID=UPI0033F43CB6
MHAGVRPYLSAGIALVGAGVIATAPVTPPPQIHSVSVELAAVVENPADVFAPLFELSQEVIAGLIAAELSDPAPVLTQFVLNQIETATVTGGIALNGISTVAAVATGLPVGIAAAVAAIAQGNPGQAPIEILNAVGTPVIQFLIQSVPDVEWVLQRPLAVAQALVPVILESALSGPISLGLGPVKWTVDTAVAAVGNVLNAASTGDPVATINAFQHGVKDVAMQTVQLGAFTAEFVNTTRQGIKAALQTQPAAANSALARGTAIDQDVEPEARVSAAVGNSAPTTRTRPSLRSVFGNGNKVRPGPAAVSRGDDAPAKAGAPAAVSLKSMVDKVKSGLHKPVKASAEDREPNESTTGDSQE